jgi:hypothetical protein
MKLLTLTLFLGAAFLVTASSQAASRVSCPTAQSLRNSTPHPNPEKPGEWIFEASTTGKNNDTGRDITYKFEGSYELRAGEQPSAIKRPGNPTAYGTHIVLPCRYTMRAEGFPDGILTMYTTVKHYKKCDPKLSSFSCEK